MKLLLAIVCDDARVGQDGKLDIHGVFNELYATAFPARQDHLVLVLVVEWAREDHGRFQFRVDLMAPDGKPSLTVQGHTDVDSRPADRPPPRTQLIMPLETVIFPEAGEYRFRVKAKGQEIEGPALHLIRQG